MQSNEVKRGFAQRLHELCDEMDLPTDRGRQTALARKFDVTPNAARKWLHGLGMPELNMAIRIAARARVNVLWLLQGTEPKTAETVDTAHGELLDAVKRLPANEAQQVFDFIRYKFERADLWFASERLVHYLALLDAFSKTKSRKP